MRPVCLIAALFAAGFRRVPSPRSGACRRNRSCACPMRRWCSTWRRRWSMSMPPRWCRIAIRLFDDPIFRRFFGVPGGRRQPGATLARLGRHRRRQRPDRDEQPRHRGRRRGEGLARRQARVRGVHWCSRTRALILQCCASRMATSDFRCSTSPIPMRCRSATSCWRSAIRSVSDRR